MPTFQNSNLGYVFQIYPPLFARWGRGFWIKGQTRTWEGESGSEQPGCPSGGTKDCEIKVCELDLKICENCGIKDCEWEDFYLNCRIKECKIVILTWKCGTGNCELVLLLVFRTEGLLNMLSHTMILRTRNPR